MYFVCVTYVFLVVVFCDKLEHRLFGQILTFDVANISRDVLIIGDHSQVI